MTSGERIVVDASGQVSRLGLFWRLGTKYFSVIGGLDAIICGCAIYYFNAYAQNYA